MKYLYLLDKKIVARGGFEPSGKERKIQHFSMRFLICVAFRVA